MKINVKQILPNPHRDLSANPIRPEQVQNIVESIKRTGFWDNLVVRKALGKPGFYELAYGHHRMAAVVDAGITEVDLPVRDLSDWEMYECMVDENNTQLSITPAMVFENVGVGARLLEKYLRECETLAAFEQTVSHRSPANDANRKPTVQSFAKARAAVLAGEGVGKDLVQIYVPGAAGSAGVVSTVLDSLYGAARKAAAEKARAAAQAKADAEAAADRKARADALAAAAERRAAEEEVRAAERRDKASAEAKAARARADAAHAAQVEADRQAKLRKAASDKANEALAEREASAREIAKKVGIEASILKSFESPTAMAEFAALVKRLNIPAGKHAKLAEECHRRDWSKMAMREQIPAWWDIESGAYKAREDAAMKQMAVDEMRRRTQGGDLNAFLSKLADGLANLRRDMVMARDAVQHASPTMKASIVKNWPQYSELIDEIVNHARGVPKAVPITPATKMLSHRNQ